jgi:hypothetical protein
VAQKKADGRIVPKSPELRAGLAGWARKCKEYFDQSHKPKDILEIFFAHFDSRNPQHGCAANALILEALKTTPADLQNARTPEDRARIEELLRIKAEREAILTQSDIADILHAPDDKTANILLLEKKSIAAITNFFNDERKKNGLPAQDIVGIAALYDTATKGIIFNPLKQRDGRHLSTTDLTKQYQSSIQSISQGVAQYGKYRGEDAVTPDNLLEFSQDQVAITKRLLNAKTYISVDGTNIDPQNPNQFLTQITRYVDEEFKRTNGNDKIKDLSDNQKQAIRFYIAKTVALQYLKGLTGADRHNESYMGVALGSEFVGKYDTEQMFGSSPADLDTLIKQINIELGVMRNHRPDILRPIVFATTSIERRKFVHKITDPTAYDSALANNLRIYEAIARHPTLKHQVAPIGVLMDETRQVIEVLDHSTSL